MFCCGAKQRPQSQSHRESQLPKFKSSQYTPSAKNSPKQAQSPAITFGEQKEPIKEKEISKQDDSVKQQAISFQDSIIQPFVSKIMTGKDLKVYYVPEMNDASSIPFLDDDADEVSFEQKVILPNHGQSKKLIQSSVYSGSTQSKHHSFQLHSSIQRSFQSGQQNSPVIIPQLCQVDTNNSQNKFEQQVSQQRKSIVIAERRVSLAIQQAILHNNNQQNNMQVSKERLKSNEFPIVNEEDNKKQLDQDDEELNFQVDEDDGKDLTEEEAKTVALYKFARENFQYSKDNTYEKIMKVAQELKPLPVILESRTLAANKGGGKECKDKKLVKTIRAIGKQIIKQVGKSVLSGSFNLTTISFPIRAMIPKSALEKALMATCLFPIYINRAALSNDPVERLKLCIVATIGNFYINCSFLKPLNPILGETISASYKDGTKLFAEQSSHHPPISYFLVYGPNESYKFYGFYLYDAKAGLNSLSLKNTGRRYMQFKDGQTIQYNFASEEYSGSFWGAMKLEALGKMTFTDTKNNLVAELAFDNVKRKPTDYFQGEIKQNNKQVSKIFGSYMGFINFDEQRYWDFTKIFPHQLTVDPVNQYIRSDHSFRKDRKYLLEGNIDQAQKEKDLLETTQRNDASLRKEFQKKKKS